MDNKVTNDNEATFGGLLTDAGLTDAGITATTITTTGSNWVDIQGTYSGTTTDSSGLIWNNPTYGNWTVENEKATKEELQKIIKNRTVLIEIDGVYKEAKLSDLLETGYLTLKTL